MINLFKMIISAGHGGGVAHNRGALCYNEGDNNYYFSLELKKAMEVYEGVQVDLIRKNINDNPPIHERSAMGKGYHLYYSAHSNATGQHAVRGSEVWDSVEKPNKELAKALVDAISALFKHNNRGVKYREGSQIGYNYYGELRFNGADSAMIVEMGFHTNQDDCMFFRSNHKALAEVQALIIAEHYGLQRKDKKIPEWQRLMNEEMKQAVALGITNGLNPNEFATRAQVVSMIMRSRGVK